MTLQPISLYFHIPFCQKKCPYCHFYVTKNLEASRKEFLEALRKDLFFHRNKFHDRELVSIYFGGGTPSLLHAKEIETILSWVFSLFTSFNDALEITLESNPDTVSREKLLSFRRAGINRISFGVQSFDEDLLRVLGRSHSAQKAKDCVIWAKESGFENISIDLMYDLPGQTMHVWEESLRESLKLPLDHISLYNLIIEEGSAFFRQRKKWESRQSSQEVSLKMFSLVKSKLEQEGFEHYEISAFSKWSKHSKHNTGYWQGREFIGLGPSAFSYFQGSRFKNISNLKVYIKNLQGGMSCVDFIEKLSKQDHLKELFLIELRLLQGITLSKFEDFYAELPLDFKKGIYRWIREGFLEKTKSVICLSNNGLYVYDSIASDLI